MDNAYFEVTEAFARQSASSDAARLIAFAVRIAATMLGVLILLWLL